MRLFLVIFILEGFLSLIFKNMISAEILSNIWIVINCFYLLAWFYKKSDDKIIFYILTCALIIRLLAMIYDQNIARLPFNNADAYKFQETAVMVTNALPNTLPKYFTGFYSQVLGVIYYIFGVNIYLAYFLNIIFIMLSATKLIDIGHMLKISSKNIKLLIILWLFMPIPFLMGYALLREASIYYFVVLSVYYFLKWFEDFKFINIILSLVTIYIGGLYHGGVFAIAAVYTYTYIFYNKSLKKIPISFINVVFILVGLGIVFGYISSEGKELFNKTNAETGGGSSYLTSVDITNAIQFIIFAPIKGFYLLFSPMPWLIRGGLDIATFLLDVSIWGLGYYTVFRNYKKADTKYVMLLLAVIAGGMLFGMGTHNTGTAMRHRNKMLAPVIVAFIAVKDKLEKEKEEEAALIEVEVNII